MAPEEKLLGTPYLIDEIKIEGVERFSKAKVLKHLHIGESSWIPLFPDYTFNEAMVAVDAQRLEELYQSHGYHRAVVSEIDVEVDEDAEEVDLRIVVEEGEPTLTRRVTFAWSEGTEMDEAARLEVEAVASLLEEKPFEVPRLNDSIGAMRLEMQRRGYPMAQVSVQADVNEGARVADAVFRLDSGAHATIGNIVFEGLEEVPQYMVDREVRFAKGEAWSPALVAQVVSSVKAMQVFRWVAVLPTSAVTDGVADMVVRVSEADPQSIRLGVDATFEATRWQQRVSSFYTHTNLFGHLTRLDLTTVAGWAELPDPFVSDAQGPIFTFAPHFTKKGLLDDNLVWTLRPTFSANIQDGYQYYSPSNRVGVARWFDGWIRMDLSHNLRFVDFFNIDPALGDNATQLGRDFQDPFTLSFLELQASFYNVDSLLSPTNGVSLDLTWDLAGGVLAGDFDFQKFLATAKGYWKPWSRVQFAARVETGLIVPFGDEPGAPLPFKFYLGGPTSVRGWGSRRLSPQLFECGDETQCKGIPIGGFTMLAGNLEMRVHAFGDLYLVGFADMGDVQAEDLTFKPEEWNFTAGPGVRYDSPVGLFRLDFGFRLNDPGVYPEEPSWALYFGIGETF